MESYRATGVTNRFGGAQQPSSTMGGTTSEQSTIIDLAAMGEQQQQQPQMSPSFTRDNEGGLIPETVLPGSPQVIGGTMHQSPSMVNAGNVRARTTGIATNEANVNVYSSPNLAAGRRPQSHPGLRMVQDNYEADDAKERKRQSMRNQQHEEPILDELLNLLPYEMREYCIRFGRRIYPSLQLINVHTDLQEAGEEIIFNAPASKVRGVTAGLAFHLMSFVVSLVITLLVEWIEPSFFNFDQWFFSFSAMFDFWKFFIWAGILASGVWYLKGARTPLDAKTLGFKALNSIGVAVLEELGYRWVYICMAMVALQSFNFVIHYAGLWVGLALLIAALAAFVVAALFSAGLFQRSAPLQRFFTKFNPTYTMIGSAVLIPVALGLITGGMVWMLIFDGVFDYLILPVTNALSLYQFDDMLNGWFGAFPPPADIRRWRSRVRREAWKASEPNRFFVYGMLLSNITFRDGHKYQGLVGWINSWYVGLVLLSAMVHHGWFTALAVHILYELQFLVIGFIFRRFRLARGARGAGSSHSQSLGGL